MVTWSFHWNDRWTLKGNDRSAQPRQPASASESSGNTRWPVKTRKPFVKVWCTTDGCLAGAPLCKDRVHICGRTRLGRAEKVPPPKRIKKQQPKLKHGWLNTTFWQDSVGFTQHSKRGKTLKSGIFRSKMVFRSSRGKIHIHKKSANGSFQNVHPQYIQLPDSLSCPFGHAASSDSERHTQLFLHYWCGTQVSCTGSGSRLTLMQNSIYGGRERRKKTAAGFVHHCELFQKLA